MAELREDDLLWGWVEELDPDDEDGFDGAWLDDDDDFEDDDGEWGCFVADVIEEEAYAESVAMGQRAGFVRPRPTPKTEGGHQVDDGCSTVVAVGVLWAGMLSLVGWWLWG